MNSDVWNPENEVSGETRAAEMNELLGICATGREIKKQIPAIPPRLSAFPSAAPAGEPIWSRSDPFRDDIRRRSTGISHPCPRIRNNLIGPAGSKLQTKAELTVMRAPVRQILLCIEELQTFNMVSGIDLRHRGL